MDNVTHGLFGYALARALPVDPDGQHCAQSMAIWTSVIASNAPDFDLVMNYLVADPKLGYLVHHRGHTHTFLWAVPLGLLCGLLVALAHGLRSRSMLFRGGAIGALAAMLHIGFDAFNNYGVHPFHPFDSRWYYGDAVFIVEPMLLSVMAPLLAVRGKSRFGRAIGWLIVGVLAFLLLGAGAVSTAVGVVQAVWLVLMIWGTARYRPGARMTMVAVAGLVAMQFACSSLAGSRLRRAYAQSFPERQVLDVARSPYPGNPVCWNAVVVSTDAAGRYFGQHADVSLAPGLFSASECRLRAAGSLTAPVGPGDRMAPKGARFGAVFSAPVDELRRLSLDNCRARAALRFLRAPFWVLDGHGVIGDLRYDREPGLGFAEVPLEGTCLDPLPNWTPPRAGLLQQAAPRGH